MTDKVLQPKILSRRSPSGDNVVIHAATVCWNIKTLESISAEFGVDKSNEKAVTLQRGFEHTANLEVAKRLEGRRFMMDMQGRDLPYAIGRFEKETLELVDGFVPDGCNEPFIADIMGEARDATRFKLMLKAVMLYTRLLYTNESDNDLLIFEVITEPKGDGTIQAAFRGCSEDRNLWSSLTEVSGFKMDANV
jgi:hypothetical protein